MSEQNPDAPTSIPMRETVKRGIRMMHDQFNREHSEYLLAAATEAGLDPAVWKPNVMALTWDRLPDSAAPTPPAPPPAP